MTRNLIKKIILLLVITAMMMSYFLPILVLAKGDLEEQVEQIGDEFELKIKDSEQWNISKNGEGNVIAKWTLSDKTLRITGNGEMKNFTSDSDEDFKKYYKKVIKRVIIEGDITNIGDYSFYNFFNLEEILISDKVTDIGECAFSGCESLKKVNIPSGVTKISEGLFYNCKNLKEIYLHDDIKYIDKGAFGKCENLENINLPKNIEKMGTYVFQNCTKLKKINIPGQIGTIGASVFSGCSSLTEVNIQEGIKKIDRDAFFDCINLTSIELPDKLEEIEHYAFIGCYNLETVNIPETVTTIWSEAFEDCKKLQKIYIPEKTSRIGDGAFSDCENLKNIEVSDKNKYFISENGILYNKDKTELLCYPGGKEDYTEYTIPNSVTSIVNKAFKKNKKIETIVIPVGVTEIKESTFSGCENLKNISLPTNLTNIENDAFFGCSSIQKINIPSTVTNIGERAFASSGIQEINIPSTVTNIGERAFAECNNLLEVNLPENIKTINSYTFSKCSNLEKIYIPDSVEIIASNAFLECPKLKEINLSDNITNIDENAISSSTLIICNTNSYSHKYAEENKIPYYLKDNQVSNFSTDYQIKKEEQWDASKNENETVTAKWTLENYTLRITGNGDLRRFTKTETNYKKYKNLIRKVIIENGITYIDERTFAECHGLEEVSISGSVKNIDEGAFWDCRNLTTVNLQDGLEKISTDVFRYCIELSDLCIPDSVTNIEFGAFADCTNLIRIQMPEKMETMGSCTFLNCRSLKQITIPEKLTKIRYKTFDHCSSLTQITIPKDISEIESEVFNGCEKLENIIVDENNTKYISENGILYDKQKNTLIRVPCRKEEIKNFELNQNIKKIEEGAFYGCSNLIKIVLPEGITEIPIYTFYGCKNLKEINIPETVNFIGFNAFNECESLEHIRIPDSVTRIGSYAFSNCSSLEHIRIPDSVTRIESDVFSCCSSLESIEIPENVESIENYAFDGCTKLKEIFIPQNVKEIGMDIVNTPRRQKYYSIIICKRNSEAHKYAEANQIYYIIDDELPKANTIISPKGWTNKEVNIEIQAQDDCSGLSYYPYSFDGGVTWQKENTRTYKENTDNIVIKVKDKLGNIASLEPININKIDKDNPKILSIDGNTEKWGKEKILTVNAEDNLSGLAEEAYSFDGGATWQKENFKKYIENKDNIVVKVKDKAGNIAEAEPISIIKIDNILPNITSIEKNIEGWTNEDIIVTVNAEDNLSGLAEEAYSFDGGATWQKENKKTYTENKGNVLIKVRDIAMNEAEVNIAINNIDKQAPIIEGVKKGESYSIPIMPKAKDENLDIVELEKNGEKIKNYINGQKLIEEGSYKLTAKDKAGNKTEVEFSLHDIVIVDYIVEDINNEKYINYIKIGTKGSDIAKMLKDVQEYRIIRKGTEIYSNKNTSNDIKIATGDKLVIFDQSYIMVVRGDANRDAESDIKDIFAINKHRLNKIKLEKEDFMAADVNQDEKVDIKDIFQINKYRLGKINSL